MPIFISNLVVFITHHHVYILLQILVYLSIYLNFTSLILSFLAPYPGKFTTSFTEDHPP